MKTKRCHHCDQEFTPDMYRRNYCSPECAYYRQVRKDGYLIVVVDGEPMLEHRRVMELTLGRLLTSAELVHHKDGNKQNNTPDNLEVLGAREHSLRHCQNFRSETEKQCSQCKLIKPRSEFYRQLQAPQDSHTPYCKDCSRAYQIARRERAPLRTCERCGAMYASLDPRARFCSRHCIRAGTKRLPIKECPVCGTSFQAKRGLQIYCSNQCVVQYRISVVRGQTLTFRGKTLTVREWERETGINREAIYDRLRKGWSLKDALTIPTDALPRGCSHKLFNT